AAEFIVGVSFAVCNFKDPSGKESLMGLGMNRWSWWRKSLGSKSIRREALLDLLRHRYVREKQHAMRYRQHAEE
ncbi:MAG TPA: hypothetical protein VF089_20885, partial [Candidatus Binatia bacterium]